MTVEEYFQDWIKVVNKKELLDVIGKLKKVNPSLLCPTMKNVFKAFELCPYNDCKAVFIGQDPFPQKGVATGILFGNAKATPSNKLSPSLKIVMDAAIDPCIPKNGPISFDITLESWARQGILMINSALTCEVNKVSSHVNLWRPFISQLLANLSNKETGIVYVLFGRQAQTFKPYIGKYNDIIEIEHPAYFARNNANMPSTIFYEINKLLKGRYNTTIKWYEEI